MILITNCLKDMCCLFFATNHSNYARYMVRYHLNLLNIEQFHPGIRENGKCLELFGTSSVRHTSKSFTRNSVDLTREQTDDADAASKNDRYISLYKEHKCKTKVDDHS